jgi:hypothetical protein
MKTVLDQPDGERADVHLGHFPVLAHDGLLNCARNLELQQRLLCVFKEIPTFGQQSWRCLERVQDPLLYVSSAALKVAIGGEYLGVMPRVWILRLARLRVGGVR